VRLEWSFRAQADRETIFDAIEDDNPQAAITIDGRIGEGVRRLTQFPESGRPGRINGTRELIIRRTPYIAVYRIADETVRVLRVLHGARAWPEDFPDPV